MDIVVRTPHGVADVSVLTHEPQTTLQDVVRLVTGQAVPAVAELDGRAVDTATPLDHVAIMMGSVIDTTSVEPPVADPVVALLQLAGRGAGTIRPLAAGRYRIGPGRRLNAEELSPAKVELTALEITVGDDGTVEARPGYSGDVTINGQRITEPERWPGGMLSVGGRVFAFESPATPPAPRRLSPPDQRGMVAFNRPPRSGDDGPRRLVVDAVRDAIGTRRTLWRQRVGDLAAFTVPIGLAGDPPGPITLDLSAERGVAIAGSEPFTTGLARTVMIETCTLHGPADLDVSVATSAERMGRWDWTKWLPHVRSGSTPRILSGEGQLHEWVAVLQASSASAAGQLSRSPLTLLVVDDPDMWTRRDSPLVPLLSSHPTGLRVLTLVETPEQAPAICTATITEAPDGSAHLVVADRGVDVEGVVPALTETGIAVEVARHLAPLDDTERPSSALDEPSERGPESLGELLDPRPADEESLVDAWRRVQRPLPESPPVPVGFHTGERLTFTLAPDRNVLVTGARHELAADVGTTIVCALAAELPPDSLSIVHVATSAAATMDVLDELPHLAGRFDDPGAGAATRLVLRLAHAVGALDPADGRVMVVIDDARGTAAASPGLVEGLIELTEALPALQLVVCTDDRSDDHAQHRRTSFAVRIDVDEHAGHRRASLRIDSERIHVPFAPFSPTGTSPARGGLVVRPNLYGRAPSPLERRLDMLARYDSADPGRHDFARFADELTRAANRLERRPASQLVPAPLPEQQHSTRLLAERPGDAVPLGMVDLPERAGSTPFWWQPGEQGSLLLLGSPRSGIDSALSTLVLGVASRFSADDLHVYAIDPLSRRRVAVGLLPHTGATTTPDRVGEVGHLLEFLADESERRMAGGPAAVATEPSLLLLVHDLGQLRRHLAGRDDVLDRLTTIADAAAVNVNVVASAWRVDDAGHLLHAVADQLVGAMAEPTDYELLGIVDPAAVEEQLGRCWSTTTDRLVQLATPPGSLVAEVGGLEAEPATSRLPARPSFDQVARP